VAARGFHGPEVACSSQAPDPISFTLKGTPPNWSQGKWHGHWSISYSEKKAWLERTILMGLQARLQAQWAICRPEKRIVEIRCYRVQLMDHDGATTSIKPILDGLKVSLFRRERGIRKLLVVPGAGLVYDDSPEYVELVSPGNLQTKVAHRYEEHTVVTVRVATSP